MIATYATFVPYLGGGKRDRTDDLLHAMQALSQLSYTPEEARIMEMTPFAVNLFLRSLKKI